MNHASAPVQGQPAPPAVAPITDANPTVEAMLAKVARFQQLKPTDDYVDAALPGCDRTTWRVIGDPAVAPIAASAFHLNLVRCEPGMSAPLHNHLTEETFFALTGDWEVFWGPEGERKLSLSRWDTITVPPGVSRGFRNVSADAAMLIGIAAGQDPGMINWPMSVRQVADAVGVALPGKA